MKWKKVFEGCYHGFDGTPNPVVILERNDFGRKYWGIELVGHGRITDKGSDCFILALAKQIAIKAYKERATCPYCSGNCPNEARDSVKLCDTYAADIDDGTVG